MSKQCMQGITADTLSAWRSHALSAADEQQIAQHIPTCSSCQHVLHRFERIAQAVRIPPDMPSQDALWRSVRTTITNQRGTHVSQSRRLWLSSALIASALIVVTVASFLVLNYQPGKTLLVATATTAATSTIVPTPTVQTLHPIAGQDWVQPSALAVAKSLSFSQQYPLIGYACGNNSTGGASGVPFHIVKTTDGGRTWQSLPDTQPTTNLNCQIFVSPTNPLDIILWETACWVGCGEGQSFVSRSLDGGITWTSLTIPSGNENTYYTSLSTPVWVGTALFFTVIPSGFGNSSVPLPLASHQVAVSVNDGPLHWINAPIPTGSVVPDQFALGNAYYIGLDNGCPIGCPLTGLVKTSDDGQTWSSITLTGNLPGNVKSGNYSKVLYSYYLSGEFGQSLDGGMTWTKIPALPAGFNSGLNLPDDTPDGTLYAELAPLNASHSPTVYKLPLGATTWTEVVALTRSSYGQSLITVSWGTDGHPIAIWGATGNLPPPSPGISYHAP